MICGIQTLEQAEKVMDAALLAYEKFHPLVFDLAESLDPNDVEVTISQCQVCDLTVHYTLGADQYDVCPRCREGDLRRLVDVLLVVQGSVVVFRRAP